MEVLDLNRVCTAPILAERCFGKRQLFKGGSKGPLGGRKELYGGACLLLERVQLRGTSGILTLRVVQADMSSVGKMKNTYENHMEDGKAVRVEAPEENGHGVGETSNSINAAALRRLRCSSISGTNPA